ncbi:MAG: DUF58 domain-containing protein [Chloroflexota bacterium]|nr:MAG: DUF58 domain-containing protein [Chloroflexota bacterium]
MRNANFDEATLRKLNQLSLVATQVRAGVMKGDRRSTKRGTSVEFADYRDYTPGDDLRRLDWNVYARLDRPFIKLLEEEEDLAVHVLVDASKSMAWGEGDQNKLRYALRLAAAIGAIALGTGDRLTTAVLQAGKVQQQYGPWRGSQHLMRLLAFLDGVQPAGLTDLNHSLRDYALAARRPGLAFVISDLFAAAGHQSGLADLQGRGHEVTLVHVLSPDELDPPLAGDLRLVDVETGHEQDISLDAGLRDLYRRRVSAWQEEIRESCQKRNVRYMQLNTEVAWDKVVLYEMRRAGVVK